MHAAQRRFGQGRTAEISFEGLGDEKGKFQTLGGVQAGIAISVIAVRQMVFANRLGAAGALGYVLAGHFDVDAAGLTAFGLMDGEKAPDLFQNALERTGLIATGRGDGIAVHGIAGPDHLAAFPLHRPDQRRQYGFDPVGAQPADDGQPARHIVED